MHRAACLFLNPVTCTLAYNYVYMHLLYANSTAAIQLSSLKDTFTNILEHDCKFSPYRYTYLRLQFLFLVQTNIELCFEFNSPYSANSQLIICIQINYFGA